MQKPRGGGTLVLSAHVDGTYTVCPKLTLTVEGATVMTGSTTRLPRSTTCVSLTSKGLVTFDLRTGAVAAVLTLPSTFRLNDQTVTFSLTTDTATHVEDVTGRRTGPIWTT